MPDPVYHKLDTRLSDGGRAGRSGLVRAAQKLGSDGGFARYRLTVVPWIWLLGRGRHNRVFQDKTVVQIVEAVFAGYADIAAWQWTAEVSDFLADTRPRSYCVQYNESDYAFISRLLAEEGLGWCVDEDKEAPAGHHLRLFADNQRFPEDPLSQSANGGLGLRYHRADSQEEQDAIVAFGQQRRLTSNHITAISYDYKAKKSVTLGIPGNQPAGGKNAPSLESHDDPGLYAWATASEAERYGRLAMESREARQSGWLARSTVRTLRPGTYFDLIGVPHDPANPKAEHQYLATDITHVGINNLSGEAIAAIAQRLGQGHLNTDGEGLSTGDCLTPISAPGELPAELLKLAVERGYGNCFDGHASQRQAPDSWLGEELLDSGKRDGKVRRYFVAETLITEPSNISRPVIAINMSVGGCQDEQTNAYRDPSLTKKESLTCWDAIFDSLRAR